MMLKKVRNKFATNIQKMRILFLFSTFLSFDQIISIDFRSILKYDENYKKLFIECNLISRLIKDRLIHLFVIFFIQLIIMTSLLEILKSCVSSRRRNSNVQF